MFDNETEEMIIDWESVKSTITDPYPISNIDVSLLNKIVVTSHNNVARYFLLFPSFTGIRYTVVDVKRDMSVLSPFPDQSKGYATYKDYYEQKYKIMDLDVKLPLLEVKTINSTPRNLLLPPAVIVPKSNKKTLAESYL
jgi:hypothetical protein